VQQTNNIVVFNFKSSSTQVLYCFVLNLYEITSSSPKVQATTENSSSFDCIESHGITTKISFFYFLDYFIKTRRYVHHLLTMSDTCIYTRAS